MIITIFKKCNSIIPNQRNIIPFISLGTLSRRTLIFVYVRRSWKRDPAQWIHRTPRVLPWKHHWNIKSDWKEWRIRTRLYYIVRILLTQSKRAHIKTADQQRGINRKLFTGHPQVFRGLIVSGSRARTRTHWGWTDRIRSIDGQSSTHKFSIYRGGVRGDNFAGKDRVDDLCRCKDENEENLGSFEDLRTVSRIYLAPETPWT